MQVGDIILKVNHVDTVAVEHVTAVNALKSAGEEVRLVSNIQVCEVSQSGIFLISLHPFQGYLNRRALRILS